MQGPFEVPDPGFDHRPPGHDDDIAWRQARDELPDRLAQDPPSPVPDDGAADAAPDGEADARDARSLPGAMVQDEFGPGNPYTLVQDTLDVSSGPESVLFTDG